MSVVRFPSRALVIALCPRSAIARQVVHGICVAANEHPARVESVLVSWNGLAGVLAGQVCEADVEELIEGERAEHRAGALGTDESQAQICERIVAAIRSLEVGYVFLIGGSAAVGAACELRDASARLKRPLRVGVIPLSTENEVAGTAHSLGFGSLARNLAHYVRGEELDNRSFYHGIKINVTRGRFGGWVAAAAALADWCGRGDELPDVFAPSEQLIYVPEAGFSEERFLRDVQRAYERNGCATVVVSEGLADLIPGLAATEGEGKPHQAMSIGNYLAALVAMRIRATSSDLGGRVRVDTLGHVHSWFLNDPSPYDRAEAFWVGAQALRGMMEGGSGFLMSLVRRSESAPRCETAAVPLGEVRNRPNFMPRSFLNREGNGVTLEFLRYAAPLAGISQKRFRTSSRLDAVAMAARVEALVPLDL